MWIVLGAVAMGTLVAVAHFADYRPIVALGVGETVLAVPLLVGIGLGLLFYRDEPQALMFKGFLACLGAILLVTATVLLPVSAGIVSGLGDLGASDSARIGALFTALFIIPIHLLGNVIGRGIAELLPPAVSSRVA